MLSEEKICGKCGEKKLVKEFHKNKTGEDGYQHCCKACSKAYQQSESGKDARKRAKKKYGATKKGRASYARANASERGRAAKRRYNNSEKGRKAQERFHASPMGKQSDRKFSAIRRARETQADGDYTYQQWYNLCKFYDFRCLKCDMQVPFEKLTLDHIKPISKGGSSFIWNLQPLCGRCNSSKGAKEIDYRKILPDWINRDSPVWQQDTLF